MKGKIFTPDEANRMLPLVSRIADDIVATYADVNRGPPGLRGREGPHRKPRDPARPDPAAARRATSRRSHGPRPLPGPDRGDRGPRRHGQGLRARHDRLLRRGRRRDRLPLLAARRGAASATGTASTRASASAGAPARGRCRLSAGRRHPPAAGPPGARAAPTAGSCTGPVRVAPPPRCPRRSGHDRPYTRPPRSDPPDPLPAPLAAVRRREVSPGRAASAPRTSSGATRRARSPTASSGRWPPSTTGLQEYPWEIQRRARRGRPLRRLDPQGVRRRAAAACSTSASSSRSSRSACGGIGVALRGQRARLVPDPPRRHRGAEAEVPARRSPRARS